MLSTPYLPPSLSLVWDPQTETHKLLAESVIPGAPPLHTWARDTEHAPRSSPARFQGEKKGKKLS